MGHLPIYIPYLKLHSATWTKQLSVNNKDSLKGKKVVKLKEWKAARLKYYIYLYD
jgi:hypothetical protein